MTPRFTAIYLRVGFLIAMQTVGFAVAADATNGLEPAVNLQADAQLSVRLNRPVIILFSLPGCHFCDEVRQNYLAPLTREVSAEKRPIVREIVVTSTREMTGFAGERTNEKAVAKSYAIRVTPTVLMLDSSGKLLTPAVVGGDTSGLYGGILDNALQEANRRLHAQ